MICSARGCRETAVWALHWRNPKIHDDSRVKTWLACQAHRATLETFLSARDFPVRAEPFHPPAPA